MGRLPARALSWAAVLAGLLWAQETVFRVDVRLVRLLVRVTDAAGKATGELTKDDFRVFDNSVRQQVAVFERYTVQPLSVAVLIDTSASTGIELRYEVDSVNRFFRALFVEGNPQDTAALYSFNHEVTLATSFTRNLARLAGPLKQLDSVGGTSLYDALFLASRSLQDRSGRRVMVVVTDGGDTTSYRTFHDALEAAHLAEAVIFPVLVVPIPNDAGRNVGGENALTSLSLATGGRMFTPSTGPALDAAFQEILRELRTQYLLGFYPKSVPLTKNRFHTLRVEVLRPDLRVSTRSGYYGDYEQPATESPRQAPAPVR